MRVCCLNCARFKVDRGCTDPKGARTRPVMPAAPVRCPVFKPGKTAYLER